MMFTRNRNHHKEHRMSITVQAPSTPGFHVFDIFGNIVFTSPVRGEAINYAIEALLPGVVSATGALVWGTRSPAGSAPKAPKAPKAEPKAPKAAKPRTRPAASGNPTPGANGCSLRRLKAWAAKYDATVATGADAVVVTILEGTWNAGTDAGSADAGHLVVRFADHANARAAYGAALALVKEGVSA